MQSKSLPQHLAECVRRKAGFERVYNKDCAYISDLILSNTGESISASTLKRFFGLVNSNGRVSSYTLDTLSLFIGFDDFESFKTFHNNSNGQITPDRVQKQEEQSLVLLQKQAEKHSNELFSDLPAVSNLIHRKEFFSELHRFISCKDYNVYPILAPAGFGKTISAYHFATVLRQIAGEKDLVILTKASFIAQNLTQNCDLAECLTSILGKANVSYTHMDRLLRDEDIRKVIIIDAVDEAGPYRKDVLRIFKALMNQLSNLNQYPNCKVIFTQRSENWNACVANLQYNPADDRWFHNPQSSLIGEEYITLPELTDNEINHLWKLLTGKAFSHSKPERSIYFRSPNHIKLLSRIRHKPGVAFAELDIVIAYIQYLMYDHPESTGIRAIFKEMNRLILEKNHTTYVLLHDIDDLLSRFPLAWEELLGNNVIKVSSYSDSLVRKPFVTFTHYTYLECLLALFWYQENDHRTTHDLELLHQKMSDKNIYIGVLENLFWIFFREHRLDLLLALLDLDFDLNEKKYMARSLFDVFQSDREWLKQILHIVAAHKIFRLLYFEHLVPLDDLMGTFGDAIKVYLDKSETNQDKLFAHSIIALKGILQLDLALLSDAVKGIKPLLANDDVHEFPRVRGLIYCAIFEWMCGNDPNEYILKAEDLTEEALANPYYPRPQMIMHLVTFGLWLMGKTERIYTLYNKYEHRFPSSEAIFGNAYESRFFLSLAAMLEYSGVKSHDYDYSLIDKKNVMDKGEKLKSKCVYDFIKAGQSFENGKEELAVKLLEEVLSVSKNQGFTLFEVLARLRKAEIENDSYEYNHWMDYANQRGFGKLMTKHRITK